MAGSKHCYSAYSKSRGTTASQRSLIKHSKKIASSSVRLDITVDNRTFFETTLALCKTDEGVRNKIMSAFVTADAGPGTRVVIQPWAPAEGYASSSSEEDDWLDRLLSPEVMEEQNLIIEQVMKEEAARRARERERVEEIRKEMAAGRAIRAPSKYY